MMEFSENFGIVSNGFFGSLEGDDKSSIEDRGKESFESHRDFGTLQNYEGLVVFYNLLDDYNKIEIIGRSTRGTLYPRNN